MWNTKYAKGLISKCLSTPMLWMSLSVLMSCLTNSINQEEKRKKYDISVIMKSDYLVAKSMIKNLVAALLRKLPHHIHRGLLARKHENNFSMQNVCTYIYCSEISTVISQVYKTSV